MHHRDSKKALVYAPWILGKKKPANIATSFFLLFKSEWGRKGKKRSTFIWKCFSTMVSPEHGGLKPSATVDWHKPIALEHCSCIRSGPKLLQLSFDHQNVSLVTFGITRTPLFPSQEAKSNMELHDWTGILHMIYFFVIIEHSIYELSFF